MKRREIRLIGVRSIRERVTPKFVQKVADAKAAAAAAKAATAVAKAAKAAPTPAVIVLD